jgi:uncharacterized protein (DUF2141 family)
MLTGLTKKALPLIVLLGRAAVAPARPLDLFTVSGQCQVTGHGLLHVFLVDEWSFSVPMSGIRIMTCKLATSAAEAHRVTFSFTVPRGTYGIRCFLDVNGNGALDGGLSGPPEPWGMSWRSLRPVRFPRFHDIAFAVADDVSCPLLVAE